MKKLVYLTILFLLSISVSKAQYIAMDFNTQDCNGNPHHLFADLDAGKVVLLHFFMPFCASCPPPAQQIQSMANNIMNTYPGMITAYAFPYDNNTICNYTTNWVMTNGLTLYAPMDSGAAQVANYGGFGMPTVVVLGGGSSHRVMFVTQSFTSGDTSIMTDSIENFLNATSGVREIQNSVSSFKMFPNPANGPLHLELTITQSSNMKIEVLNLLGEVLAEVYNDKTSADMLIKKIETSSLCAGSYIMRVTAEGKSQHYKFSVIHE